MIDLIPIYQERQHVMILYELLKERTPDQSISHERMPTLEEHTAFVRSQPYLAWYLIARYVDGETRYVGSVYLTKQREVGIFIFKAYQGEGYGRTAVRMLRTKWPGQMFANINPRNKDSIRFFKKLGGKHVQNTYRF